MPARQQPIRRGEPQRQPRSSPRPFPVDPVLELPGMIGNRGMSALAASVARNPPKGPTIGNLPRDEPVPAQRLKLKYFDGAWREVKPHLEHRKDAKFSRARGWYDFVLKDGELWAVKRTGRIGDPNARRPGHTEAAGGGRVTWAGQVRFSKSGAVTEWNDGSGHYRPASSDRGPVVKAGFPEDKFKQHPDVVANKNKGPGPQLKVHQPDTKSKDGGPPKIPPGPPREKELDEAREKAKAAKANKPPVKPPSTSGGGGGGPPSGGGDPPKTPTPPAKTPTPPAKTPTPPTTKAPTPSTGGNTKPYVHSKHGKLDVDLGRGAKQGVKRALGSGYKLGGKAIKHGGRALRVWGALSALGNVVDTLTAFNNGGVDKATQQVLDALDKDFPPVSKLAVDALVKKMGPLDNKKFEASAEYLRDTAGNYIDSTGALTVPHAEQANADEIESRIGYHITIVERYRREYTRLENVFADHMTDGAPLAELVERHRNFVSDVTRELFELAKAYAAWYRLGEELLYLHLAADHAMRRYGVIGGHINQRIADYAKWMEEAGDVLAWAEDLMADWGPRWVAGGRRVVGTNYVTD